MKTGPAVLRILLFLSVVLLAIILGIILKLTKPTVITSDPESDPVSSTRNGELRVDFIDVGKSDCILITTESHTMMIDTGYKNTYYKVSDYLDNMNVEKIDLLVISHFDKDHIGGAKKLLSDYLVKQVYIPDYDNDSKNLDSFEKAAEKYDTDVMRLSKTVSFTADNAEYSVIPSGVSYSSREKNDNDMSLLVTIEYESDSFLFAGDIEEKGINSFLGRNDQTYDIIKIPHHGRIESNSKDLLDSVKPIYAVITDDDENKADKKLCSLLEDAGISYYCTKDSGTVTIRGNGSGAYRIETEKQS